MQSVCPILGRVSPETACQCVQLCKLLKLLPFAQITLLCLSGWIIAQAHFTFLWPLLTTYTQWMPSTLHSKQKSNPPDHEEFVTSYAHWVYAKTNVLLGRRERASHGKPCQRVTGSSPFCSVDTCLEWGEEQPEPLLWSQGENISKLRVSPSEKWYILFISTLWREAHTSSEAPRKVSHLLWQ